MRRGLLLLLVHGILFFLHLEAIGKANRVFQMPNGNRIDGRGCINCHTGSSPSVGNAPLNPFGEQVWGIVGNADFATFWSPSLAALDADGDGFSNGAELGDANGDLIVERITNLTNPGDTSSNSGPGNDPPAFTSTPVLTASVGEPYFYRATASDSDGDNLVFAKSAGPTWLSVIANGAMSGTPPVDSTGVHEITLKVTDDGTPPRETTQIFNLAVGVSFAGWLNLNFSPTSLLSIRGPHADPDGDLISNFQEYALNLDPVLSNAYPFQVSFDASNRLSFAFDIRDNDPALSLVVEVANELWFTNFTVVTGVVTDPTPNDQMKRFTYTDSSNRTDRTKRFIRFRFSNSP